MEMASPHERMRPLDNYLHFTTKGKQDGQDTFADCVVSSSSLSGVKLVMFS
jgi:hypothetical protein